MPLPSEVTLRAGTPADDVTCARNFSRMWQDMGIPASDLRDDFIPWTLGRIREARLTSEFRSVIAEFDGTIVASACSNLTDDYPIFAEHAKRRIGVIWAVYVERDLRGRGIAKAMMQTMVADLRDIDCAIARLRASPAGMHVYRALGFGPSNEMELQLA